jgi:pimeloyl-ACP methyl ester carboxylesterase
MWAEQRRVLSAKYRLLVPDRRGYGSSPDGKRGDLAIEVQDLLDVLGDGAHLVGFSYGGLLALLAAARKPEVIHSLTVIEPPVFDVAQAHPAVHHVITALTDLYNAVPQLTPEEFSLAFSRMWGDQRTELPVFTVEQRRATTRMMAEQNPAQVSIPLDRLATAPFPKLVLSGGWAEAFEVLCDTLSQQIGGERAVISQAGHTVRHPAIATCLATFLAASTD